ncbi:hypothetical protein BDP81DRAFT_193225 [Colletotrichum phormii]|uniref:Uncharacterized protein n=1 Tax=Colletotrichum phormii TaxID=359342 RepID=A0AAI9ZXX9_9PEZI|nr:uncharacterized protein BDP81DRAFT_193225 [Colletotrichum phormii]KAK1638894.1 hypothetical protein BDP81DRAFT_193225 [Colletotrichum phormii]
MEVEVCKVSYSTSSQKMVGRRFVVLKMRKGPGLFVMGSSQTRMRCPAGRSSQATGSGRARESFFFPAAALRERENGVQPTDGRRCAVVAPQPQALLRTGGPLSRTGVGPRGFWSKMEGARFGRVQVARAEDAVGRSWYCRDMDVWGGTDAMRARGCG